MKNRDKSLLVEASFASGLGGGAIVIFDQGDPAGVKSGVELPFGKNPDVTDLLAHSENPAAMALKIISKDHPNILPEMISEIDRIAGDAGREDGIKLSEVREELRLIREGVKP